MKRHSTVAATLIVIFFTLLAPGIVNGANQPPHVPESGVNCDSCHLPATDPVWAAGSDPDQNEHYNRICWKWHNDFKVPFKITRSSAADTVTVTTRVNSSRMPLNSQFGIRNQGTTIAHSRADGTGFTLSFVAMSNYPYNPAVEHYPDDAEHNQYRTEFNTHISLKNTEKEDAVKKKRYIAPGITGSAVVHPC